MTDAAAHATEAAENRLTETLGAFPKSKLTGDAREMAKDITSAIYTSHQNTKTLLTSVETTVVDEVLPVEARASKTGLKIEEARKSHAESVAKAQGNIDVLRARLALDARRPLPKTDGAQQMLREDLRLELEAASDPIVRLQQLAEGSNRELAAVAASDYSRRLVASITTPDIAEAAVKEASMLVVQSSLTLGNDAERAAAEAWTQIGQLQSASDIALHLGTMNIEAAGETRSDFVNRHQLAEQMRVEAEARRVADKREAART